MFLVSSKKHKEWEEEKMWVLKGIHGQYKKCAITAVFFPSTKRRADLSNKWESVGDLLVKAGILEDDNWFCVVDLRLMIGEVDKHNPRVELYITEI